MIAAGFGCRRDTSAEAILAAYRAALVAYGIERADVMATADRKRGEPGLMEAQRQTGVPLRHFSMDALEVAGAGCLTQSRASLAATGLASLAEAAALAACGTNGHLLGPRVAQGPVTCALATTKALP